MSELDLGAAVDCGSVVSDIGDEGSVCESRE